MEKIKLSDGTIINISNIELVNGALKITTPDLTVEELADIFRDKSKTNYITILTESGKESGYKQGFTSFSGIAFDADGSKTVEMFQPVDVTEARLSNAEGAISQANIEIENTDGKVSDLEETINALLVGEMEVKVNE